MVLHDIGRPEHGRKKGRVIVGMSGGVDSAAAAYLLKEAGYEVIGVTLRTWESGGSRCCEIDEARRSAGKLGISYYPWNEIAAFREHVIQPFLEAYAHGLTPNPCVDCNRYVKWEGLLHIAAVMQADYVATGHYASVRRMEGGRLAIRQAEDGRKDQSYMLYRLTQEQLSRTLLPLGEFAKQEVREIAAREGFFREGQAESQEICFVAEGSYADYVEKMAPDSMSMEGNFVDSKGHVLGRHKGIVRYTIGQRKGLGLSLGYPAYVKRICTETNEIVVGEESSLYTDEIFCNHLVFMGIPGISSGKGVQALVRIRYHHVGAWAMVEQLETDVVRIAFRTPVRAPAPGQSAVFYDNEGCILGGGTIMRR